MSVWSSEKKAAFRKEHTLVMPEKQPRHNCPHADVRIYFDTIFGADCPEYKGMVSVAAKDASGEMKIVAVVPAAQMGEWVSQMHVSPCLDYYYGKAQHSGNATWGADRAFAFNALYVDIDCHDGYADLSPAHVVNLLAATLPDRGLPVPNLVEHSGRGIHLVWLLEQVSAKLEWMVRAVSATYAEAVQTILGEYNVHGYQVDLGYSANIAGLTRLPGTYNTAAHVYAAYDILHSSRMDLPKAYDSIPSKKTVALRHDLTRTEQAGQKRVEALLRLNTLRPIEQGQRDIYLLHLYSAAQMAGMSNEDALALARSANATFSCPLPEQEVARNLRSAAQKHYFFYTTTIIAALAITPDEQTTIGLTVLPKYDSNRARKARNAAKKRRRDREIMRWHLLGLSVTAIARKVRHAYNTVRKVIETYAENFSALFSEGALRKLRKQRIKAYIAILKSALQILKTNILCLYNRCRRTGGRLAVTLSCRQDQRRNAVRHGPP